MRTHVPSPALRRIFVVALMATLALAAVVAQSPALAAPSELPLTATQNTAITGLSPGGAAMDIDYTITNPNTAPLSVSTVKIAVHSITYIAAAGSGVGTTWRDHPAGGAAPGCTAADFTIVAPGAPRQDVKPGATSITGLGGSIAMVNSNRNQDDCQGILVTLTFSIP